ncbi:MAG TPA: sulfotransferase [Steroidobacteraceae bacterium]|nr:sulfotransferase [Steroidobacteraceae bacterium]
MQPAGQVEFELIRVAALLEQNPPAAARAAVEILRAYPAHPTALLLLAAAHRASGDPQAAAAELAELARSQPGSAVIHFELGRALRAAGRESEAAAALEKALALAPGLAEGWRELSLLHDARGEAAACDAAYARFEELAPEAARLSEAVTDLANQRYGAAEELLRRTLAHNPQDTAALRLLAQVMSARENYREAERLLAEALRLAPGYSRARLDLVRLLHQQQNGAPMLPHLARLLAADPRNLSYRTLEAQAHGLLGETERALAVLEDLVREFPDNEAVWVNYGQMLRTAGQGSEAVAAYRKSLGLKSGFASAWMALADLKTFRFAPGDVAAMQAELAREQLPEEERSRLEFALGKALEDTGDFAASFAHYARANARRRALIGYRAENFTRLIERTRALYTREFFAERAGWGCPAADPVFLVGLPRAGSTLIEQILASHSQVEGTRELGYVAQQFVVELGDRDEDSRVPPRYPQSVAELTGADVARLGERYLSQTRAHRRFGRPHFTDKMGSNFQHVGLIHLMLPNARIIDVRRAPLACCFANFRQHFYRGALFSYSLEDLGRCYRDYVALMAHFDAVLPGRVYRVDYESLVRDLEGEVRRLLAHCGLPFEEQTLRFHETRRAVQTVSSEQVRQPLYADALEQWRNFEPWLGPLKEALGELATTSPRPAAAR